MSLQNGVPYTADEPDDFTIALANHNETEEESELFTDDDASVVLSILQRAGLGGGGGVITEDQGEYPLRSTVTTDETRFVEWRGETPPPSTTGYFIAGIDRWLNTTPQGV